MLEIMHELQETRKTLQDTMHNLHITEEQKTNIQNILNQRNTENEDSRNRFVQQENSIIDLTGSNQNLERALTKNKDKIKTDDYKKKEIDEMRKQFKLTRKFPEKDIIDQYMDSLNLGSLRSQ